jgi:hypothetical protein
LEAVESAAGSHEDGLSTLIGAAIIRPICGRYASFLPVEALASFGTVNLLPNLAPSWNVAPTQGAAVVRRHPDTGGAISTC